MPLLPAVRLAALTHGPRRYSHASQDHDNAHWLAPFDPAHDPSDPKADFPTHLADPQLHEYPQSGGTWSEDGVLRGGFVRPAF
jgi:hypothetical protein